MNILYYDKNMSYEDLNDLWNHLKDKYPEGTLLFLPNSVRLLIDASAEQLMDIQDKIALALTRIQEERPEEYNEAKKNRWSEFLHEKLKERDKQWLEEVNNKVGKAKLNYKE